MGKYEEIADKLVIAKIKKSWLKIEKFYNELASENDSSMAMAFVLMAINNEKGSTVTSIAPRIGMAPNSLSRTLKMMNDTGFVYKKKSKLDKRKVYICLTEKGLNMQKMALDKMFALEDKIKASINQSDLQGFFKVIDNISDSIDQIKE